MCSDAAAKTATFWPKENAPCQVRLEECSGLTFVSNTCAAGRDDGGKGIYTPQVGLILRKLSHSVITSNTLYRGFMDQMVLDLGEHGDDYIFANNVGSQMK